MNDDSLARATEFEMDTSLDSFEYVSSCPASPEIPSYLEDTYWWAYLRPKSIWLFEREWLVNLILWGNMRRLTEAVLEEFNQKEPMSMLQVACVYGDFSNRLTTHIGQAESTLHILDIAPIQLDNVRKKLSHCKGIRLHQQDSSEMKFSDRCFDNTVVFFLLHEQPEHVRRKTVAEAIRVTQPGGKVVFVDYHGPKKTNPLRYLMTPVLKWLEPFAMDLWRTEIREYLPESIGAEQISSEFYCGGLYQKIVISC